MPAQVVASEEAGDSGTGSEPEPDAVPPARESAPPTPPPEVFVAVDADPPAARTGLRVQVVTPWGPLQERPLGGSRFPALAPGWEVELREGEERPEVEPGVPSRGSFDLDGLAFLDAALLPMWRAGSLHVQVSDCREIVVESPPADLREPLVLHAEPAGEVVIFRGRVRDDRGRPLAGAGVFCPRMGFVPGASTGADGAFELRLPCGYDGPRLDPSAPEDEDPSREQLAAVAPGFLATTVACRAHGEDGLDLSLDRDAVHGRLELTFLAPEGSPAAGTRVWILPEGATWQGTFGWERREPAPTPDDSLASPASLRGKLTRLLLPRVCGGACADEQGCEVCGNDGGPLLLDLTADARGVLVIPAILPGRYRVRAARGVLCQDSESHDGMTLFTGELNVRQTLEATVEVLPLPGVTRAALRLAPARAVTGRIEVARDPSWHCDHAGHRHWIGVEDWVWSELLVQSGSMEAEGGPFLATGRFRMEGIPLSACRLTIRTFGHPAVSVDVPAASGDASGPIDLGTLRVPDARQMFVETVAPDGASLGGDTVEVRMEGCPGAEGDPSYIFERPPPSTARIVVRRRKEPYGAAIDEPAVVLRAPFDFGPAKPLRLVVPDPVPASDEKKSASEPSGRAK